jgi:hypothetical protein
MRTEDRQWADENGRNALNYSAQVLRCISHACFTCNCASFQAPADCIEQTVRTLLQLRVNHCAVDKTVSFQVSLL